MIPNGGTKSVTRSGRIALLEPDSGHVCTSGSHGRAKSRPSTSSFRNRRKEDVGARDKRGHDAETLIQYDRNMVLYHFQTTLNCDAWIPRIPRAFCSIQRDLEVVLDELRRGFGFSFCVSFWASKYSWCSGAGLPFYIAISGSAARSFRSSGISVIVASVSNSVLATDTAFSSAMRTTLVGSMIPASIRST